MVNSMQAHHAPNKQYDDSIKQRIADMHQSVDYELEVEKQRRRGDETGAKLFQKKHQYLTQRTKMREEKRRKQAQKLFILQLENTLTKLQQSTATGTRLRAVLDQFMRRRVTKSLDDCLAGLNDIELELIQAALAENQYAELFARYKKMYHDRQENELYRDQINIWTMVPLAYELNAAIRSLKQCIDERLADDQQTEATKLLCQAGCDVLSAVMNQANAVDMSANKFRLLTEVILATQMGIERPESTANRYKFQVLSHNVNGTFDRDEKRGRALLIATSVFSVCMAIGACVGLACVSPALLIGAIPLVGLAIGVCIYISKIMKQEQLKKQENACPLAGEACRLFARRWQDISKKQDKQFKRGYAYA